MRENTDHKNSEYGHFLRIVHGDGCLWLICNHQYYTQCHMEMGVSKKSKYYFFLYTYHGYFLEELRLDRDYWLNLTSQKMKFSMKEKCPNTEFFWSISSCIQSEYREIRTRINSVFGQLSRSVFCHAVSGFSHPKWLKGEKISFSLLGL